MSSDSPTPVHNAASRAGIRRTVWILAALAVGSYVVFLLSVMGGK
jgi:hypothetical protein